MVKTNIQKAKEEALRRRQGLIDVPGSGGRIRASPGLIEGSRLRRRGGGISGRFVPQSEQAAEAARLAELEATRQRAAAAEVARQQAAQEKRDIARLVRERKEGLAERARIEGRSPQFIAAEETRQQRARREELERTSIGGRTLISGEQEFFLPAEPIAQTPIPTDTTTQIIRSEVQPAPITPGITGRLERRRAELETRGLRGDITLKERAALFAIPFAATIISFPKSTFEFSKALVTDPVGTVADIPGGVVESGKQLLSELEGPTPETAFGTLTAEATILKGTGELSKLIGGRRVKTPKKDVKVIKPTTTRRTPLITTFADEPIAFVGGRVRGETFDLFKAPRAAEKRLLQTQEITAATASRLDPLRQLRKATARELRIEKALRKRGLLVEQGEFIKASQIGLKKLERDVAIRDVTGRRLGIPGEKARAAEARIETGLRKTRLLVEEGKFIKGSQLALGKIQKQAAIRDVTTRRIGIPTEKRLAADLRMEQGLRKSGLLLERGKIIKGSQLGLKKFKSDVALQKALDRTIVEAQMPGQAFARARKRFGVDRPITVIPKARPAPIVFDISKDAIFKLRQERARVRSGADVVSAVTKGRTTQLLVKPQKLKTILKEQPKVFQVITPKELGRIRSLRNQIGTPRQLIRARQKRLTRLQKKVGVQQLVSARELERLSGQRTIQLEVPRKKVRARARPVSVPRVRERVAQIQLENIMQAPSQIARIGLQPRLGGRVRPRERQAQPTRQKPITGQPSPPRVRQRPVTALRDIQRIVSRSIVQEPTKTPRIITPTKRKRKKVRKRVPTRTGFLGAKIVSETFLERTFVKPLPEILRPGLSRRPKTKRKSSRRSRKR